MGESATYRAYLYIGRGGQLSDTTPCMGNAQHLRHNTLEVHLVSFVLHGVTSCGIAASGDVHVGIRSWRFPTVSTRMMFQIIS